MSDQEMTCGRARLSAVTVRGPLVDLLLGGPAGAVYRLIRSFVAGNFGSGDPIEQRER
jgi:hypothetical protein